MYDFYKNNKYTRTDGNIYKHQYFLQGQKHLITQIQRKSSMQHTSNQQKRISKIEQKQIRKQERVQEKIQMRLEKKIEKENTKSDKKKVVKKPNKLRVTTSVQPEYQHEQIKGSIKRPRIDDEISYEQINSDNKSQCQNEYQEQGIPVELQKHSSDTCNDNDPQEESQAILDAPQSPKASMKKQQERSESTLQEQTFCQQNGIQQYSFQNASHQQSGYQSFAEQNITVKEPHREIKHILNKQLITAVQIDTQEKYNEIETSVDQFTTTFENLVNDFTQFENKLSFLPPQEIPKYMEKVCGQLIQNLLSSEEKEQKFQKILTLVLTIFFSNDKNSEKVPDEIKGINNQSLFTPQYMPVEAQSNPIPVQKIRENEQTKYLQTLQTFRNQEKVQEHHLNESQNNSHFRNFQMPKTLVKYRNDSQPFLQNMQYGQGRENLKIEDNMLQFQPSQQFSNVQQPSQQISNVQHEQGGEQGDMKNQMRQPGCQRKASNLSNFFAEYQEHPMRRPSVFAHSFRRPSIGSLNRRSSVVLSAMNGVDIGIYQDMVDVSDRKEQIHPDFKGLVQQNQNFESTKNDIEIDYKGGLQLNLQSSNITNININHH